MIKKRNLKKALIQKFTDFLLTVSDIDSRYPNRRPPLYLVDIAKKKKAAVLAVLMSYGLDSETAENYLLNMTLEAMQAA